MKNKKWNRRPYAQIIRKMYEQTLGASLIAILVVLLFRSAGNGKIGNWITALFCRWYDVGWDEGVTLYWRYVRQYYIYILVISIAVVFLVFFRILLSGFTRYFDEIVGGINALADGDDSRIEMSEELHFVEEKLRQVKNELVQRTKEKEDSEKRKDELIVYLAHDIKTPLTSVIGYLNLLVDSPDLPAAQQTKYLHVALDKALRLESLINDFFEITRSHVQGIALERSTVSLSYLMAQVVEEAYPLFQQAGKTVETEIEDSLRIHVDAQKMARVFTNLLKNAIYYSEGSAPIRIRAAAGPQHVSICFSNAGHINTEQLAHIFDKFYRLDNARQTRTGGAGLGLAIAKEIVEAHGGTLTAACADGQICLAVALPAAVPNNGAT